MKISFFGHADSMLSDELQNKILKYLSELLTEGKGEFMLGGYGNFDAYALKFGLVLKKSNRELKLTLVSPYIDWSYLKKQGEYVRTTYDEVVYSEIEQVPKKYAISARNKWIVNASDVIVTYINHKYGGAYSAYLYAIRKHKAVINFGGLK